MYLEQLLKEQPFVIYANGRLYEKGTAQNSFVSGKNRTHLSEPISFFDKRNQHKGNYITLEQCLRNVVVPYLNNSTAARKDVVSKFFPKVGPKKALYISQKGSVLLKQKNISNPLLVLDNIKYVREKQIPRNTILQDFIHAENSEKNKEHKEYTIDVQKRQVTLINRLPTFKMANNHNELYEFSNVTACVTIRAEGGKYTFSDPFDKNKTHHPFIYSDGEICAAKKEYTDELNIQLQHKSINEKFVTDLCSYFLHSRSVLFKGYQKRITPVKSLNRLFFLKEYRGKK